MKEIRSPVILFKNLLAFLILSWFIAVDSPTLGNYHTDIVKCEDDQKQFESDFNKTCLRIESFFRTLFYYNNPRNINMNCSHRGPVFCYSEKRLEGCIYVERGNNLNEAPNFYELSQKFFTCNEISQAQQDCLNLLYYKYLALFYKFHNGTDSARTNDTILSSDSETRCGNSHGWYCYVVALFVIVAVVVTFLFCCFNKERLPNFNFKLPKSCNWATRGKKTETEKPDQSFLTTNVNETNGHEAKVGEPINDLDALEHLDCSFLKGRPEEAI